MQTHPRRTRTNDSPDAAARSDEHPLVPTLQNHIIVSGCSKSVLNGTYVPCGIFASKTMFKNELNNSHLYYSDQNLGGSDGQPLWRLNDGEPSHTGWEISAVAGSGMLPPLGKWAQGHNSDISSITTYPTITIQTKHGSASLHPSAVLRFSGGRGERAEAMHGDFTQDGTHDGRPKYVKVGDTSCVIGWSEQAGYLKASRDGTFPDGWIFSGGSGATPKLAGEWGKQGCDHGDSPPTLSLASGSIPTDVNANHSSTPHQAVLGKFAPLRWAASGASCRLLERMCPWRPPRDLSLVRHTPCALRMAQPVLCACVGQGSRCVCSGPPGSVPGSVSCGGTLAARCVRRKRHR